MAIVTTSRTDPTAMANGLDETRALAHAARVKLTTPLRPQMHAQSMSVTLQSDGP